MDVGPIIKSQEEEAKERITALIAIISSNAWLGGALDTPAVRDRVAQNDSVLACIALGESCELVELLKKEIVLLMWLEFYL